MKSQLLTFKFNYFLELTYLIGIAIYFYESEKNLLILFFAFASTLASSIYDPLLSFQYLFDNKFHPQIIIHFIMAVNY